MRYKAPEIPDDFISMKYTPGIMKQGPCSLYAANRYDSTSTESYSRYSMFLEEVTKMLKDFGIHITNTGYSYIIDAVLLIIDRRCMGIKLNQDVYPYIADKYDPGNISAVEHNIRNAIKTAYLDNERMPGTNSMHIFISKPTNKQFLMYVAEAISRKMRKEIMSAAG